MNYTQYTLTHWESPGDRGHLVVKDGKVSVTPEFIYETLTAFQPVGYREGEISLDIPVADFLRYWESLGGEYEVEK